MGRLNGAVPLIGSGKVDIQFVHQPSNAAHTTGGTFVIHGQPVVVTTGGVDVLTEATLRMAAALAAAPQPTYADPSVDPLAHIADAAYNIAMAVLKRCQQGPKEGQTDAT